MKKYLTVALLLIVSSLVGQTVDTTEVTQVTQVMIYNDVKEYLSLLGNTLNNGAKYGFEILTKYYFAIGISRIILYVIIITNTVLAIKRVVKVMKYADFNDTDEILAGVWLIVSLSCLVVVLMTFTETVTMIYTPEYHAIKEILDTIK